MRESDLHCQYREDFVMDLAKNYVRKQEAMNMLGMTRAQLWHWAKEAQVKPLAVGKSNLWRTEDVVAGVRKKSA
mgnify:CR=1 FL=1